MANSSQRSTAGRALLGVHPDNAEIKLPPVAKVCGILLVITVILGGCSGLFFYMFGNEPDQLYPTYSSTKWRVQAHTGGVEIDWRVCALQLFSDDACTQQIDLSGATAIGSSTVPAEFKDASTKKSAGSSDNCDKPWISGSAPEYIGWELPSADHVSCMKAHLFSAYNHCDGSFACGIFDQCTADQCDKCCTRSTKRYTPSSVDIEVYNDGTWTPLRMAHVNSDSAWQSWSATSENGTDNTWKTVHLVLGIVLATFAGCGLLITPLVACELHSKKKSLVALKTAVENGEALPLVVSDHDWTVFVEDQWGRGGVVHKAQTGIVAWIFIGLFLGVFGSFMMKVKSSAKRYPMPWFWCFVIGMPLGVVVTIMLWAIEKAQRRCRYKKLISGRFPAFVGPSSCYFAGNFVQGKHITSSSIAPRPATGGCARLIVAYTRGKETSKVSIPIPDESIVDLRAFLGEHRQAYGLLAPGPREPTAGTSTDTNGNIVMVPHSNVQVMEP